MVISDQRERILGLRRVSISTCRRWVLAAPKEQPDPSLEAICGHQACQYQQDDQGDRSDREATIGAVAAVQEVEQPEEVIRVFVVVVVAVIRPGWGGGWWWGWRPLDYLHHQRHC